MIMRPHHSYRDNGYQQPPNDDRNDKGIADRALEFFYHKLMLSLNGIDVKQILQCGFDGRGAAAGRRMRSLVGKAHSQERVLWLAFLACVICSFVHALASQSLGIMAIPSSPTTPAVQQQHRSMAVAEPYEQPQMASSALTSLALTNEDENVPSPIPAPADGQQELAGGGSAATEEIKKQKEQLLTLSEAYIALTEKYEKILLERSESSLKATAEQATAEELPVEAGATTIPDAAAQAGSRVDPSLPQQELSSDHEDEKPQHASAHEHGFVNPVCQALDRLGIASDSSLHLWTEHLEQLLRASRMDQDNEYMLHDKNAEALKFISPRLMRAVRTLPHSNLNDLLAKAHARYEYLQAVQQGTWKGRQEPPVVKILVMGGNVASGLQCWTEHKGIKIATCAWPARLEQLLNHLAGGALVQVITATHGGANTRVGTNLLEYNLLPAAARRTSANITKTATGGVLNVDIIVNAYSTNDAHGSTMEEAKAQGMRLSDLVFEMAQNFTRAALKQQNSCNDESRRPLLIWLDDYLGNEQREIVQLTEIASRLHVLANYYGFGLVSYADAVRDVVYGDTREGLLSPPGWYRGRRNKKLRTMKREVHPSDYMHATVTYVLAHYLLHATMNYCHSEPLQPSDYDATLQYNATRVKGLPELLHPEGKPQVREEDRARPRPRALPPPITAELSLDEISDKWRGSNGGCSSAASDEPLYCPFSWYSAYVDRTYRFQTIQQRSEDLFKPYLLTPSNWELEGVDSDVGWVPKKKDDSSNELKSGADMILEFPFQRPPGKGAHSDQPRETTLTLFVQKSNQWDQSDAVQVTVRDLQHIARPVVAKQTISSFHATSTRVVDPVQVAFNVSSTSTSSSKRGIRVKIQTVGQSNFKILGMTICS